VYVGVNAAAKIQQYSITSQKIANNLVYGSDLTVSGNLTVNGQTTTIDTTVTTIEDPVILLASNQTGSPSVDIGFIGERGTSNNIAFVWDESSAEFVTVYTTDSETNTTVSISSYANFHTNDANIGGNLAVGGNISITGNVTSLNVTGNITGGNLLTPGVITATGNVSGGNVTTAGQVTATGNVSGGNVTTAGLISAGTTITATGNITGGNLTTTGQVSASGNVNAPRILNGGTGMTMDGGFPGFIQFFNSNGSTVGIDDSGNINGTIVSMTGNITGGNLNTGGTVNATGNVNGTGAVFSGNVSAQNFFGNIAGNIDAGGANTNIQFNDSDILAGSAAFTFDKTSNAVTATGNITGANLTTSGITSTGSLTASTTINATGNITGGNLSAGSGIISTTGNINGANINATAGITAGTTINATGNITGGNLITTGDTRTGTLETTGNALIGGNLIVQGNITYINIDDLRVEDPIIILGTGPNGAPLTTDDGLDRGIFMEYYKTGLGNAYMGWKNSSGNMVIASSVNFTGNDIVGINAYGTLEAGNLYIQSAVSTGNITGGNLSAGSGIISTTGNVNGANINASSGITAGTTITATGNITGGNLTTTGITSTGSLTASTTVNATGNITGGNLTTTGITSTGSLTASTTVDATGNITGGNLITTGLVSAGTTITATGNITGGNVSAGSGIITTTGNINGGNLNITSRVAAATGYFTGNVDVLGNLNATVGVVYANSGIFLGDAVTGNGAAFAGIPNFTPLGSNVVMQFAGNVNSYSQINFENINNGTYASTDYIATADNGNDTSNYVNMGIASSTYDYPDFAVYEPNDAYLHNNGGNLLINPETAGKVIKFVVGGTDASNIVGTVSSTGIAVTGNVSATTALIGGNITVQGSNINSNAAVITVNSDSADTNFAVNGDTLANIFFIDAGTGTASFGSSAQTTNAIVAFNASNSILMPVGNTGQRPATGVTGMLRFNSTTDSLEVYDNSSWTTVGVPSFTVIDDQQFNGDGVTVAFTINSNQTTNSCIVSINGVVQIPTIAYSVSGTTLTFTEPPESGDIIDVRQITTTTTVTAISNSSGNAVIQVSDTTNDVSVTGDFLPTGNATQSLGGPTNYWSSLYVAGSTIYLGNLQIKAESGSIAFYESDGTTPAPVAASSVDTTTIANGTSSVSVIASGGNIRANVGGTTVQTISPGLVAITGDLSVTGNATLSGNILGDRVVNGTTSFEIQTPSGNANISVGGTSNVAVFTTTGLTLGTGSLTVGNIVNSNANGVGNIGATGGFFNTIFAKATSAQYADLAEKYTADAEYAPGTVVVFGGDKEVTVTSVDADRAVAGVVSTNPSYIMNAGLEAEHVATVALTGRVPCRVKGTVRKGDLMVSAGYGLARAEQDPRVGTVIGKALENFEGQEGVIEVVVGRF
jgi:hypothetical protein